MDIGFDKAETMDINYLSAARIDQLVVDGNMWPLLVNDGMIVGCEIETPGAATPRASR